MSKTTIQIMLPLPHQEEPLNSPKRFKLWRWGRRRGKTRGAFRAATRGHGAKPNGKGFLEGGEILWVTRDYPNSDVVWRKEILKRFANKPGFNINKQDRRVEFLANGGSLTIVSAENIDSVRGGDWDGVVIDEAAHMKLQEVWLDVIRPGLADRIGWCIMMSTTKVGSWFNELCEKVMEKKRGKNWGHWHGTAEDNPKIDPDEYRELIDEYDDEVKLQQEVYAELVVPGGLAFGEWKTDLHVYDWQPPINWTWVGSIDWGFVKHGCFGLWALGPDSEKYMRWEFYFKEMEPKAVGYQIAKSILKLGIPIPSFIICDSQMMAQMQSTATISTEFQVGLTKSLGTMSPGLVPASKGPDSRVNGKVLMHQALKPRGERREDGVLPHWLAPRMRFHSDCVNTIRTLPKLRRDERNPEDVDTLSDDHCYDQARYLLQTFAPHSDIEWEDTEDFDLHPGFEDGERKRKRQPFIEALQEAEDGGGYIVGGN